MTTSMESEIMLNKNSLQNLDWDSLTLSLNPTRSMFVANCKEGGKWDIGELVPYGNFRISPASGVLNYGQGVFEGIKAFRSSKDRIVFFRLDRNAMRFYRSCKRLCIPPVSIEMFTEAVVEVVRDNADYVPPMGKGSMYIRPVAWGYIICIVSHNFYNCFSEHFNRYWWNT
jgi:branched-chain amino acid aminotransferase